MSLYTGNKPKSKTDYAVATGKFDGHEKTVYWTDSDVSEVVEEIQGKEVKPVIIKEQRQIFSAVLSGSSGSGKSVYANNIITDLLKADKKLKNVFLFTKGLDDDPAYKDLIKKEKLLKVDIHNPDVYEIPDSMFKDSIILYDDVLEIPDGTLKKLLQAKLQSFLTRGRKLNINPIVVIHETLQRDKTSTIHFESQHITLFPKYNWKATSSYLRTYMGFDSSDLDWIRKLKTRGIFIRKTVPSYIVWDHGVKLI